MKINGKPCFLKFGPNMTQVLWFYILWKSNHSDMSLESVGLPMTTITTLNSDREIGTAEMLKAALSRQPEHHPDVLHPFLWLLLAGRSATGVGNFGPVVQIQLMKTVGGETALKIWALTSWHGEVHRIPFRSPSPSIFPIRDMLCLEANLGCKSTGQRIKNCTIKICIYGK